MSSKPRSAHLHPGPGFRVRMNIPRPSMELLREFSDFPTPDISDLLNRLYAGDPDIRCLASDTHRICGPACTVKLFPGARDSGKLVKTPPGVSRLTKLFMPPLSGEPSPFTCVQRNQPLPSPTPSPSTSLPRPMFIAPDFGLR